MKSSFKYDSDNEEEDDYTEDEHINAEFEDSVFEDDGLSDEYQTKMKQQEELKKKKRAKFNEHYDSVSYPWLIMELSIVKIVSSNINSFLSMTGLDISGIFLIIC